MSAYAVYQIFLANTTVRRMAPRGIQESMKIKGMETEELVGDGSEAKIKYKK